MTDLHPSVIDATHKRGNVKYEPDEACARNVIRALAQPEAIPDEAVVAALNTIYGEDNWKPDGLFISSMRAALSAALLHIAGGEKP